MKNPRLGRGIFVVFNGTPHFLATLAMPIFCGKTGGKRIRTTSHIFDISVEIQFVSIITYGHTCARLLLANGVSMKQIQVWLRHSTFSTTADIYAHLDMLAQIQTGNVAGALYGQGKSLPNASA